MKSTAGLVARLCITCTAILFQHNVAKRYLISTTKLNSESTWFGSLNKTFSAFFPMRRAVFLQWWPIKDCRRAKYSCLYCSTSPPLGRDPNIILYCSQYHKYNDCSQ